RLTLRVPHCPMEPRERTPVTPSSGPRGKCKQHMSGIDYEAQYNNRQRVPEYAEIAERWSMLAAAYRLAAAAGMHRPCGTRERQRYDIFHAKGDDPPLVVYIHGGYWQRGDRKDYSFVARGLNANGISVAIPSYTLCPAVSVMEIGDEIQQCLAALWRQT